MLQARKYMMIGFPIITLGVMAFQPAGMTLTFAFTSLLLGFQALMLKNLRLRKLLGMNPTAKQSAFEAAKGLIPRQEVASKKKPMDQRQRAAILYEQHRKQRVQSSRDSSRY